MRLAGLLRAHLRSAPSPPAFVATVVPRTHRHGNELDLPFRGRVRRYMIVPAVMAHANLRTVLLIQENVGGSFHEPVPPKIYTPTLSTSTHVPVFTRHEKRMRSHLSTCRSTCAKQAAIAYCFDLLIMSEGGRQFVRRSAQNLFLNNARLLIAMFVMSRRGTGTRASAPFV